MKTTYTSKLFGDSYSITANFAEAACPVEGDYAGRQVADFCHLPRLAMREQLEHAVQAGGDDPADFADDIEAALDRMIGRDLDLIEVANVLTRHGDRYAGCDVDGEAQGWLDHDFDADGTDEWCDVGVWDAATAAEFRDAGLSPAQVAAASQSLIDECDDPSEEYADGDPIYSACNNDTSVDVIVAAAKALSR